MPDMPVAKLRGTRLALRRKQYSDEPRLGHTVPRGVSGTGALSGGPRGSDIGDADGRRPQLSSFLFTDVTAAMYQEWDVQKTNHMGKRQARKMGADGESVYNSKRSILKSRIGVYVTRRRALLLPLLLRGLRYSCCCSTAAVAVAAAAALPLLPRLLLLYNTMTHSSPRVSPGTAPCAPSTASSP